MDLTMERAAGADWRPMKALYRRAFPAEERAPFFLLRRRAEQGRGEALCVRDGGAFVGLAYLITHRDMAYLFYFAIQDEQRGRGYGSAILRALGERYEGKRLFLAREMLDKGADNRDQRLRRYGFYLRNGFEDWPCQIKEAGMVYDVMGVGEPITGAEYDALITGWSGRLVRRLADMRMIEKA